MFVHAHVNVSACACNISTCVHYVHVNMYVCKYVYYTFSSIHHLTCVEVFIRVSLSFYQLLYWLKDWKVTLTNKNQAYNNNNNNNNNYNNNNSKYCNMEINKPISKSQSKCNCNPISNQCKIICHDINFKKKKEVLM